MASVGPQNGTSFANDTTVGALGWNNTSRANASDNSYVTVTGGLYGGYTCYLKALGFDFSAIPDGATITGIKDEIEKKSNATNKVTDYSVKVVKNGNIGGNEDANNSYWGTSDSYAVYGGENDLRGLSWNTADIKNANSGVVISAFIGSNTTASIDHIRRTVYYTAAGANGAAVGFWFGHA